jgi:ElaB/YqjD/DUF883 family membrane-anchored ribosome-binding protein
MKQDLHAVDEVMRMGENVSEKIDQARRGAAESLESAASTVRSTAAQGKDAIETLAEGAATRLDSTAKYVRNFRPVSSVGRTMGQNPWITFSIGIAAGILVAFSLRRS